MRRQVIELQAENMDGNYPTVWGFGRGATGQILGPLSIFLLLQNIFFAQRSESGYKLTLAVCPSIDQDSVIYRPNLTAYNSGELFLVDVITINLWFARQGRK